MLVMAVVTSKVVVAGMNSCEWIFISYLGALGMCSGCMRVLKPILFHIVVLPIELKFNMEVPTCNYDKIFCLQCSYTKICPYFKDVSWYITLYCS